MSKKKNKWKSLPSVVRTCLIGMVLFLVAGIGLQVYGFLFANISESDIKTVNAVATNVRKVRSKVSDSTAQRLRKKGFDEADIGFEYEIEYTYNIDGKDYTYKTNADLDQFSGKEGETATLRYAMKNGEPIVNPNTNFVYLFCGVVLVIVGVAAGAAAYVLNPKNKKKKM